MSGRFIGTEQVRAIKSRVDIVQLMGEYSTLKKAGGSFVGCCAFHQERTPSMNVYPDKGTYHCFGCGAHGDAIELVKEKERVEFGDAVELLARRVGHTITYSEGAAGDSGARAGEREACLAAFEFATAFYSHTLWASRDQLVVTARDYLASRGLTEATCRRFRLGWAPGRGALIAEGAAHGHPLEVLKKVDLAVEREGRAPGDRFWERITFPICDRFGSPIAFSARLLPAAEAKVKAEGGKVGKYVNSTTTPLYDKSLIVFNLHLARESVKARVKVELPIRLIVMEGPTDVMAAAQAGVGECVAVLGTAMTVDHVRQLGGLLGERGHLYILLDGDKAGAAGAVKAAKTVLAAGVQARIATLEGGKDTCALFAPAPRSAESA
jgi:DNA primase